MSRWPRWTFRANASYCPDLQRLAQEIHIPMLYVSHSLDEIQHLANCVLVLEEPGKVKALVRWRRSGAAANAPPLPAGSSRVLS